MGNATVNLTQIPYSTYDVYIYYTGFVSNQVQAWTDGGTTLYGLRGPSSGGGLSGYVPYQTTSEATALADAAGGTAGGNYLKFTGLTGSSLTLTSLGLPNQAGFEQDGIAGIQIVNTTPANTYTTWIAGFPGVGSATGFNDDPDGDGIKNGLENYLGTNPSQSSAGLTQHFIRGLDPQVPPHPQQQPRHRCHRHLSMVHRSGELVRLRPNQRRRGSPPPSPARVVTDTNAPDNDVVEVTVAVTGAAGQLFARIKAAQTP